MTTIDCYTSTDCSGAASAHLTPSVVIGEADYLGVKSFGEAAGQCPLGTKGLRVSTAGSKCLSGELRCYQSTDCSGTPTVPQEFVRGAGPGTYFGDKPFCPTGTQSFVPVGSNDCVRTASCYTSKDCSGAAGVSATASVRGCPSTSISGRQPAVSGDQCVATQSPYSVKCFDSRDCSGAASKAVTLTSPLEDDANATLNLLDPAPVQCAASTKSFAAGYSTGSDELDRRGCHSADLRCFKSSDCSGEATYPSNPPSAAREYFGTKGFCPEGTGSFIAPGAPLGYTPAPGSEHAPQPSRCLKMAHCYTQNGCKGDYVLSSTASLSGCPAGTLSGVQPGVSAQACIELRHLACYPQHGCQGEPKYFEHKSGGTCGTLGGDTNAFPSSRIPWSEITARSPDAPPGVCEELQLCYLEDGCAGKFFYANTVDPKGHISCPGDGSVGSIATIDATSDADGHCVNMPHCYADEACTESTFVGHADSTGKCPAGAGSMIWFGGTEMLNPACTPLAKCYTSADCSGSFTYGTSPTLESCPQDGSVGSARYGFVGQSDKCFKFGTCHSKSDCSDASKGFSTPFRECPGTAGYVKEPDTGNCNSLALALDEELQAVAEAEAEAELEDEAALFDLAAIADDDAADAAAAA